MHLWVCHMCVSTCRRAEGSIESLEMGLQVVVSHPMWVLRIELESLKEQTTLSHLFSSLLHFFPLAWCIPKPWDCQVYNGKKHTSPSSACLHSSLNSYFIPSSRSGCLLRNPGYRVSCATQAGLQLVILPTSDSQVLGTQVCTITPGQRSCVCVCVCVYQLPIDPLLWMGLPEILPFPCSSVDWFDVVLVLCQQTQPPYLLSSTQLYLEVIIL